jgi:AcrR family transcriptional regulator
LVRVGREKKAGWLLDAEGREVSGGVERADAARNRRRVLDAARMLFSERGVTAVNMEEIARAAGVGKGTLYRRFQNKGLLCEELLDKPTRRFQEEVLGLLAQKDRDPLEKLSNFLDRLVWFTEENLDLLYGGYETLSGEERLAYLEHPAREWLRGTALGLLRAAVRAGQLDAGTDVEYLADALLAPANVDLFYHQRRERGLSVERISEGLRSLVPAGRDC